MFDYEALDEDTRERLSLRARGSAVIVEIYFTGNELLPHAALARFLEGHGAFPGVAAELAGILLGLEDYRHLTAGAEGRGGDS